MANIKEPVQVTLGVTLKEIIGMDEQNEQLRLNAWLKYVSAQRTRARNAEQSWRDINLVWNASEYEGIGDVRFPSGALWKPDVLLYNSVDSSFDSTCAI